MMLVAVEFPDRAAVDGFLASPTYEGLQPLRERAWARLQIFVGEPG